MTNVTILAAAGFPSVRQLLPKLSALKYTGLVQAGPFAFSPGLHRPSHGITNHNRTSKKSRPMAGRFRWSISPTISQMDATYMDTQNHKIFMEAKIYFYDAQILTNHQGEIHALIVFRGVKNELGTFYFQPESYPPTPPTRDGTVYRGYFPISAFESCMKILQDPGTKYFEVTESEPLNLRITVQRRL